MVESKKELDSRVGQQKEFAVGSEKTRIPEQNLEVSSWLEKIEKKLGRVPNDTSDKNDDTVVVPSASSVAGQQPPVTLPINQAQMRVGKKAKVESGLAWLVTWFVRKIKQITRLGGRVRLQDIEEVGEGKGETSQQGQQPNGRTN